VIKEIARRRRKIKCPKGNKCIALSFVSKMLKKGFGEEDWKGDESVWVLEE